MMKQNFKNEKFSPVENKKSPITTSDWAFREKVEVT
jgi:hypothetical protein